MLQDDMDAPVKLFKSLGDSTRLRIIGLLRDAELNVHEIQEILEMTQSRISHHLSILKEAGFVQDRREGTWIYYRLNPVPPFPRVFFDEVEELLSSEALATMDRERLRRCLETRRLRSHEFFSRSADFWDRLSMKIRDERALTIGLVSLLPGDMTVLDAGTGTGYFLPSLARCCQSIYAVDSSMQMLTRARDRCCDLKLTNVFFQRADLTSLPFSEGRVDGTIANMSLHHVSRPLQVLREFARVVRAGGRVVIIDLVQHEFEWMREEQADLWLGFNPNDVSRWFEEVGLGRFSLEKMEIGLQHERKELAVEIFVASGAKPIP